jgi:superfamily II DNA or RNA helicase
LGAVHTTAGDFNRGEVAELMDRPKLVGDVVEHYHRLAPGEQGIVFAASREHSRHMADTFSGEGVPAAHVDGSFPDRERERIFDAFRAGDIRIMSNVDLFGEGVDVPGMVYCGLARPTKSLSLFVQQASRPLRISPGKTRAIIADHAGNALRHGLPDDPQQWSLQGRDKRQATRDTSDALPVRQCKTCFRVSPSTVTECPGCGEPFPVQARKLETEEGELTKVERMQREEERRIARKIEERQCRTLEDWKRLGVQRGHKPGWARVQFQLRHGGRIRR